MGIKKLITINVEAEIEIELPEWASNPTVEDIKSINALGFDVENSDDIYREAGRIILMGSADSNNDVFGVIYNSCRKRTIENPQNKSFYEVLELSVEHCAVELLEQKK